MIRIKARLHLAFPFFAGVLLMGCNQPVAEEETLLRPVHSITITKPESGQMKTFPGVVEAAQQADLSFRVSGKLEALVVNEGDSVVNGQMVARLDSADFDLRLQDRQASYDVAKVDYERAMKLVGKGAIARADVDHLKAKLGTATAQLEIARHEKAYTQLKVPFSGQVAKVYVDNFEEVSAKQEILTLLDTTSLLIHVEMPESIIAGARNKRQLLRYSAEFDSLPDRPFSVELFSFSALSNENSQTYSVTFMMPANPGARILPGMSARIVIEQVIPDSDWLVLPAHVVQEDSKGRFVYLVEQTDSGEGVVVRRKVETGRLMEQGIEITSGVDYGEQLITAGMSQMFDGMKVKWSGGHQ